MGYYLGKDQASGTGAKASVQPRTTIPLSKAIARTQVDSPVTPRVPTGAPTPGTGSGSNLIDWLKNNFGKFGADREPLSGLIRRRTPDDTFDETAEEVQPVGGEWQWPEEMKDLFGLLYGRAGDLLTKEPGFSQNVLDEMFGRNFEKVRGQEKGARDLLQQNLASQGMLGTGTETEAMKDLAWGTEANVGDIMSNVFLANEAQKRQDLSAFTQLASQLFGQSMDYQTTQEALSASRRNEANQMLSMLLALYGAGQGSSGG